MSTEHERRVARAEALVVGPEPEERAEEEWMAEAAAEEIAEYYAERHGRTVDADALADAYRAGGSPGVERAFDPETARLLERRIRCRCIPPRGGYATFLHLCDEDI